MILMGHLGSAVYIGAIALGGTIFSVLYSFFSFLRAGTTGFTAQSLGKGNNIEIIYSLYRSVIIGIPIFTLILVFQVPIAKLSTLLLDGSEEVKALAIQYNKILAGAAHILM